MNIKAKTRILIIEDDSHIAEGLELNLSLQGYDVRVAADGVTGLNLYKKWNPHLLVLDIMLPGMNGLDVLQSIRLEDESLPVLILSAKATADDKIKGLTYGVDDYLSKPFNLEELLLRVKRLLTRTAWQKKNDAHQGMGSPDSESIYTFGDNRIDFRDATAHCSSGVIKLTEQELKLLKLFINNKGNILSRKTLLEIGWGYSRSSNTRTLDNFIVRFRKYFENNPKKPVYFKSHRSLGYIFDH